MLIRQNCGCRATYSVTFERWVAGCNLLKQRRITVNALNFTFLMCMCCEKVVVPEFIKIQWNFSELDPQEIIILCKDGWSQIFFILKLKMLGILEPLWTENCMAGSCNDNLSKTNLMDCCTWFHGRSVKAVFCYPYMSCLKMQVIIFCDKQ